MSLKDIWKAGTSRFRDLYLGNTGYRDEMPDFAEGEKERWHFRFSGEVQHVGFRIELWGLAERIGLSGWVRNMPDGDVEAELQGTGEQIRYAVDMMNSIRRIDIRSVEKTRMPLLRENGFRVL